MTLKTHYQLRGASIVLGLTLLAYAAVNVAFGQQTPAPQAPAIPVDVQLIYERARANAAESQAIAESDQAALRAAFAAVQKACGEGFDVRKEKRETQLVCVARVPVK